MADSRSAGEAWGSRPSSSPVAGFVTGSSRGIGREIARYLASLGAQVAVQGTTFTSAQAFGEAQSLYEVAEQIASSTGSEVLPVAGNLADPGEVHRIVAEIRSHFGRIDIPEFVTLDRRHYAAHLLGYYAKEDSLDQILCDLARKFGYDVVILTNMVGSQQIVTEVLDTRPREESFANLHYLRVGSPTY